MVVDDLIKSDDARSVATKLHAREWYNGVLKSRKNSKDTPIVLINHRLAPDDLSGFIRETEAEDWHFITISALGPDSKSIWEDTRSTAALEKLKIIDPFTFYAQEQQQPQIEGGNILKREWWKYYDSDKQDYPINGMVFITADTAMKAKTMNDFTSMGAWHGTHTNLDMLGSLRRKMEFPELVREAVKFWNIYSQPPFNAKAFYIEDKVSGISLGQVLAERGIPVEMWKPKDFEFPEDKVGRAKTTTLYLQAGRVRLPLTEDEDGPRDCKTWVETFIDECSAFNGDDSGYDDQVDMYDMAVAVWKTKGGGLNVQNA